MAVVREPNAEPIPGYRLLEPLGSGGFGEVWKCEAPGGLFKAIKFVYGNLKSLDMDGVHAEQEWQALNRIKEVRHPFVLSLDRIQDVDGELVIVMELADKSLYDSYVECQSAGLLGIPRDALLRYVRDAAEALDHMNEKHNLQHLDIKPRNLFLISDRVKVADFGLVNSLGRQTANGVLGGVTPLYASPETFQGKITDRSDQYSLAIVYQELLTGQRPFNGKNPRQLAQQHMQEEPELRSLHEAERPVIARALSKDPAKRFPTCLAFVRALYVAQSKAKAEAVNPVPANGEAAKPKSPVETMEDLELAGLDEVPRDDSSPRPEDAEEARLGITVAQPTSGALRPTIVVGMGSFGRRALRELRCRFLDRIGDLRKIPLLRFLYVDPDPSAVQEAVRGTPEVALSRSEVYHLPLQVVGQYRRRMLDHLSEWLPREKLYSIPRSLQTQGVRALGRLAFVDNHVRFMARLRREVQQVTHPDTLYQSVSQTGLALRDSVPRIYVIAAAGGGSSGFLVDLGYGLRRLLHQLRQPEAELTLFLFCGATTDPATPRMEQANVYAALTELNHFADPTIPFAAQYGADGPRLVDQGNAYGCTYLMQLAHRSPEALRDVVAHLGSYLFHELTTPLSLRLDRERHLPVAAGMTPFRSFGTYAVWFPRGLLLRLAARQACRHLMEDWLAEDEATARAEVEASCARVLADSELRPESLCQRIEESAGSTLGGQPADALTAMLAGLDDQSQQALAHEDPGSWARQALAKVVEWVGTGPSTDIVMVGTANNAAEWRMSRLARALKAAADRVAEDWDKRLTAAAMTLMEHPGRRIAAAEEGLARFAQFCEMARAAQHGRWETQSEKTLQAWHYLENAMEGCLADAGGAGWGISSLFTFGNRTRRQLRVFMDHLAAFSRQCLTEEVLHAGELFFAALHGKLSERLRDMGFCRQRLRHLQEKLGAQADDDNTDSAPSGSGLGSGGSPTPSPESFWESIRRSATVAVVLPNGVTDLDTAATHFATSLKPEQRTQLDQALQEGVLGPLGGLHAACSNASDPMRTFVMPLLDQAAAFLDQHLPITDVAQVEMDTARASGQNVSAQIREYLNRATPLIEGKGGNQQVGFVLIPATDAGKAYAELAQQAAPDLQQVRVPGQAHLMFCREQGYLSMDDLHRLMRPYRAAYEEAAVVPQASPHSRFDILDWMPLDP
jgi:eukaryotic-like serine/threonine-protein kinase